MRIGIDARALAAWPAGIEVYTRQLLKGFAALGGGHEYFLYSTRDFPLPCHGPFVKRLGTGLAGKKGSVWMQVEAPHQCFRDRIDLFWSPLQTLPVALPASIPAVLTVHDFVYYYFPRSMRPGNLLLLRLLAPPSWRRADAFITGSRHSEGLIRKSLGGAKEVRVIPHGHMNLPAFPAEESRSFVRGKYGAASPYILGVGTLEPRKNLIPLLRAFKRVSSGAARGHSLLLAGAKGWKYDRIFEEVEALGIRDRVVFTGAVPEEDLARFYSGADLFVFPSLYEGFGLPVLEALAFGVPVACSNSSSIPEVVGDAGILFDPGDEAAIASAVTSLVSKPELRRRLVEEGRKRAAAFSWEKAARETLEVFERTAARRRPGPRPLPGLAGERGAFDAAAARFLARAEPSDLLVSAPTSIESSMTVEAFEFLGDLRGTSFLDFGCGQGHNAIWSAGRGAALSVGFDVSRISLRAAAAKSAASGASGRSFFVCARAERLPFRDGVFSRIAGNAVIHHVEPRRAGAELFRVMAGGGRAAFTEPWSGNPLVELVREWAPYPRKNRTRGERALRPAEVRDFTARFRRVEEKPFYLLTALSKAFRGYFAGASLEAADRFLLGRMPFLGPLAVQKLLLLVK